MQTLQTLATLSRQLWKTGNDWARWALALTAAWPLVISLVAVIGYRPLTSAFGLLPVLAIVFVLVAWTDPLVIPILAAVHVSRSGIQWLATILGTELLLSVYFTLVPVHNDPGLLPLLLLVAAAQLFLALGIQTGHTGAVQTALWALLAVITVAFFAGGWDTLWSTSLATVRAVHDGRDLAQ